METLTINFEQAADKEKIKKVIQALGMEASFEDEWKSVMPKSHYERLEEEYADIENGKAKTSSWEEVKERIRMKHKKKNA